MGERHVIKNEKVALDRLRVRQNVFLVIVYYYNYCYYFKNQLNTRTGNTFEH